MSFSNYNCSIKSKLWSEITLNEFLFYNDDSSHINITGKFALPLINKMIITFYVVEVATRLCKCPSNGVFLKDVVSISYKDKEIRILVAYKDNSTTNYEHFNLTM